MLIRQLPATSRTHAATPDRWGTVEHALTHVADVLSLMRLEQLRIAGAKNTPKFEPLPRPGQDTGKPRRRYATGAERDAANALARSLLPGLAKPDTPQEVST